MCARVPKFSGARKRTRRTREERRTNEEEAEGKESSETSALEDLARGMEARDKNEEHEEEA